MQVRLGFTVRRDSTVGRPYIVETASYHYALRFDDEAEFLTWQWHPSVAQTEMYQRPHLHIGASITRPETQLAPREIHKLHLPTGRISLPMFVRMLIEEFGVEPLHEDWDARLTSLDVEMTER